jgi:hypothetical protein
MVGPTNDDKHMPP